MLLDHLFRFSFGRKRAAPLPLQRGSAYRSPHAREPEAGALRVVARLPVRVLGVVLVGDVELGLDGLRFVPLRGPPRQVALEPGLSELDLGTFTRVEDPSVEHRFPESWRKDGVKPLEGNGTVRAVQLLASSPGFEGKLDAQPHPERFVVDAAERGGTGDEATYSGGFAAMGPERLVFFSSGQQSWACAVGRDVPQLGFMDNRPELLRSALAWMTDKAFAEALDRAPRTFVSTYGREDVRRGERKRNGPLSIGSLDLWPSAVEDARLQAWAMAAGTR
jgi:hypothetical protein